MSDEKPEVQRAGDESGGVIPQPAGPRRPANVGDDALNFMALIGVVLVVLVGLLLLPTIGGHPSEGATRSAELQQEARQQEIVRTIRQLQTERGTEATATGKAMTDERIAE